MERILIVGCGDIGERVARLARARGVEVWGLVRTAERAARLQAQGINPIVADLDSLVPIDGLPTRGALVIYSAPPPGGGESDPRVRTFAASVFPGEEPAKVVYLSTSGVYGDCGGATVSEETPVRPQTARARRRLDAERLLGEWGRHRHIPVVILRVTGIYGPGRWPLQRLREGHPVLAPEESPLTNRIHADDLAQVCLAAGERGEAGEIFNVSDGQPSTMTDYFDALADTFGLPRPPRVSLEEARRVMSPLMLSYLEESRHLDNARMLARLGVVLRYPDLAAGLRAAKDEAP